MTSPRAEFDRESTRLQARRDLGVEEQLDGGEDGGTPWRAVVALGLISVGAIAPLWVLLLLALQVSSTMGASMTAIGGARSLELIASGGAPFVFAALVSRTGRYLPFIIATGLASALFAALLAIAGNGGTLIGISICLGVSSGAASGISAPLLMRITGGARRGRALAVYFLVGCAGLAAVAGLVAGLAADTSLSWRTTMLILAVVEVLVVATVARLPERISGDAASSALDRLASTETKLGFSECCRRVLLTPTTRLSILGLGACSAGILPVTLVALYYFDHRWNQSSSASALAVCTWLLAGCLGLVVASALGDRVLRGRSGVGLRVAGTALVVAATAVVLTSVVQPVAVAWLLYGVASFALWGSLPLLTFTLLVGAPPEMRVHAQAFGAMAGCVGILQGIFVVGSFQDQYGFIPAAVVVALPLIFVGALLSVSGNQVGADVDRLIEDALDAEEIRLNTLAGRPPPLLSCDRIDFSYGQLQVLFDVDLTVREGEMLALLGVNGAGKSTLLKVISGIGLPSAGAVRFCGDDITYLDAERRVQIGITQIPGGRAVFPRMTVIENLRSFGYTLGRSRKAIDEGVETSLAAFPRLFERRHSMAVTLSGGEQQMLGLSKALILKPRLLLIDELSLGLAPLVVAKLLEIVRQINANGTAVVLVEQSLNIALNLVEHAYFMEKGQIRFDGPADELARRGDLLRAVFLQGTGAGTTTMSK